MHQNLYNNLAKRRAHAVSVGAGLSGLEQLKGKPLHFSTILLRFTSLTLMAAILISGDAGAAVILGGTRMIYPTITGPERNAQIAILSDTTKPEELRAEAARLLGGVFPDDDELAISALSNALTQGSKSVRQSAIEALANLGAINDPKAYVGYGGTYSLDELHSRVTTLLIHQLDDVDQDVVTAASAGLGSMGAVDKRTIPALIKTSQRIFGRTSTYQGHRLGAPASALIQIAISARRLDLVSWIADVEKISSVMSGDFEKNVLETELEALKKSRRLKFIDLVATWMRENRGAMAAIVAVLMWGPLWLYIYWAFPLAFLEVVTPLKELRIALPTGSVSVPAHWICLGFLWDRPRVLDAWVASVTTMVRRNLLSKSTVSNRSVHVPVPVELDGELFDNFSGAHLREIMGKNGSGRLLIAGEGGSGKTSLACQICLWSLDDDEKRRPAPWRMIPVLIERDLGVLNSKTPLTFVEVIRSDLEKLISITLNEGFVRALLKTRRLLVAVDHYSEMDDETRRLLAPDRPENPPVALVVTSRHDERLGDVPKSTLRPIRVSGDYLFEFVSAYLRANHARGDFTDKEFAEACGKISDVLSGREATILLIKLCCERLIESKRSAGDLSQALPGDVPALVVAYLADLNSSIPDRRPLERVTEDVLALAWACVAEDFIPRPCERGTAIQALAQIDEAEPDLRLEYIQQRLRLLESQTGLFTAIRFTLDPLAEYWAALHVLRSFEDDRFEQRKFMERLQRVVEVSGWPPGFLAALRDCLSVYARNARVPHSQMDELHKALLQLGAAPA